MILVCDLGNTNVVFGFYEKDTFISSFRLVSSNLMGLDEYVAKLNSVIKDKDILGEYDNARDALNNTREELGSFIVQECNGDASAYTDIITTAFIAS